MDLLQVSLKFKRTELSFREPDSYKLFRSNKRWKSLFRKKVSSFVGNCPDHSGQENVLQEKVRKTKTISSLKFKFKKLQNFFASV